jgi:hypothetical protein
MIIKSDYNWHKQHQSECDQPHSTIELREHSGYSQGCNPK